MPNQTKNTQSILSYHETISENLRLIDSLSWLMIAAASNIGDDSETVSDTMLIISKLQREASNANERIWGIVKADDKN